MILDAQFANERFTQEFPNDEESAAPEEQEVSAPLSPGRLLLPDPDLIEKLKKDAFTIDPSNIAPYSEARDLPGFEEDGEGYDRQYPVGR